MGKQVFRPKLKLIKGLAADVNKAYESHANDSTTQSANTKSTANIPTQSATAQGPINMSAQTSTSQNPNAQSAVAEGVNEYEG